MVWSFVLVIVCLYLYGSNFWTSIQARSWEAVASWGICLAAVVPFVVMLSLVFIGFMERPTYLRLVSPLVLPSIGTIWILPAMEWKVRMAKANKAKEL